jgi:hypothetical protein
LGKTVNSSTEDSLIADLLSLGINPRRRTELNDTKELSSLAENLKQAMLQDYKLAYSVDGQKYEE